MKIKAAAGSFLKLRNAEFKEAGSVLKLVAPLENRVPRGRCFITMTYFKQDQPRIWRYPSRRLEKFDGAR